MFQSVLQLVPATADEFFGSIDGNLILRANGIARFVGWVTVHADGSGHDGTLGFLATVAKPALHQCLVQPVHGR